MIPQPNRITSLDTPQDAGRVDNLFSILFQKAQGKEHQYLEFSGAGVWPAVTVIPEKHIVLCYNSTDAVYRIYTTIGGVLKYVSLT